MIKNRVITGALPVLLLVVLISGCTSLFPQQQKTETKIKETQGVGVLEFRTVTNTMLPGTYNYVLLSVRNNAEGNNAKDISVSLENVEPFMIYEGGSHKPGEERLQSSQFFDDVREPYRKHKLNQMIPDEEVQFFWNIQAPSDQTIAGMGYSHDIYYTLKYKYKTAITQTIACISQEEYLRLSREGPVSLSGQVIGSPGELKLETKTQQPLLYNEGDTNGIDFTLEMDVTNTGEGVPDPNSEVIIAVETGNLLLGDNTGVSNSLLANSLNWINYTDDLSGLNDRFDAAFSFLEFETLGIEGSSAVRNKLWLTNISSNQLIGGKYTVLLPIHFNTQSVYEPQKILTFDAYIAYTYLKEGVTTVNVYPLE